MMAHSCTIERRCKVTRYRWDPVTDAKTDTTTEIVVGPCGTPLFSDDNRAAGVCRSCLKGWEVPDNAPTERGRAQIAEVTGS
jgi:hypothetical protein